MLYHELVHSGQFQHKPSKDFWDSKISKENLEKLEKFILLNQTHANVEEAHYKGILHETLAHVGQIFGRYADYPKVPKLPGYLDIIDSYVRGEFANKEGKTIAPFVFDLDTGQPFPLSLLPVTNP